jgi:hypothetical protein
MQSPTCQIKNSFATPNPLEKLLYVVSVIIFAMPSSSFLFLIVIITVSASSSYLLSFTQGTKKSV